MNIKKWKVKECNNSDAARAISEKLGISLLAARLLVIRGIDSVEKAKAFVCFSDFVLHDPFLMPDMDKATARIVSAVENKEKILVYGDYDVDGVTSVSILMLYFRSIGVDADYYIPDRSGEGYGINVAAIDRFRENGVTLMITVDTKLQTPPRPLKTTRLFLRKHPRILTKPPCATYEPVGMQFNPDTPNAIFHCFATDISATDMNGSV